MRHSVLTYVAGTCILAECVAACGGRTSPGSSEQAQGGYSANTRTSNGTGSYAWLASSPPTSTGPSGGNASGTTLALTLASGSRPASLTSAGGSSSWIATSAGGIPSVGGSRQTVAAAGAMAKIEIQTVEPTRYWFVVGASTQTEPLKLTGVGQDNRIRTFELPQSDSRNVAFSDHGDRLCLVSEDWVGTGRASCTATIVQLKEKSFVTMQLKVPSCSPCRWHSNDIVELGGETYFAVAQDMLVGVPKPPEPALIDVQTSPDGKYSVRSSYDPKTDMTTLTVETVDALGYPAQTLLTRHDAKSWQWSEDSSNLFVEISSSVDGVRIVDYDFSSAIPVEVNSFNPQANSTMIASPDGEFLLSVSHQGGNSTCSVWHPMGGSVATLSEPELGVPVWAAGNRLIWWQPEPSYADVTPAVVAAGMIDPVPLADPGRANLQCEVLQVTSALFLGKCLRVQSSLLQSIELTPAGVLRTDLLPGKLGQNTVATVTWSRLPSPHAWFLVAGTPSYYYLEFEYGKLKRSIPLSPYLGEYAVSLDVSVPGNVALLAYLAGESSYAWLSLEGQEPGPLSPIPAEIPSPDYFHFPAKWPKLE